MSFLRLYARVLGLLAAERRLAIVLALANVAVAGLQFLEPVMFGRVIDVLTTREGAAIWAETLPLLALWGAIGLGGIAANILVALHADRLAHRRRLAAMARYFEHVLALPASFHIETHSGTLIKVMLTGADSLFGLWLGFLREHLATFVALVILIPLALWLNWRLALLLIVLACIFAVLAVVVIGRTHRSQEAVNAYHSELAARAGDALSNVMLIQSYVRLALEAKQLADLMQRLLQAQFPVLNWWATVVVLTRAASTITVLLIFVLGAWLKTQGLASVGEIVSFMGFATMLIARLEQAMNFVSSLFFEAPVLTEYFKTLDERSLVNEKPGAATLVKVKGDVAFEHVTFAYETSRAAVEDLSFAAPAGATVALVGSTGAGKTTAMGLLHRLWDPTSGRITVDGADIRDYTLDSLRRNIGVVFQESALFHRSIADNLRVGKPDATMEELTQAARLAEAHDFILRQPQGYDTLVGERGATLSGGERQRLAIARALLKNPPILILDEATSALDTLTEARVQQALKALMKGRTTFVIAHRLSTIREADLILVLDHGRIVERGRFSELVQSDGPFARLVSVQGGLGGPPPVTQPG
ncbi:glucan ABC transporter ATP-binding protein/ permease [Desertibaculum subflavum]|uniref:glucan ABC transporter ATP-binding protein/ permease n=1 Tax=Desertibaculum subflavum TaxID=2268458 RepID=UPI000E67014D